MSRSPAGSVEARLEASGVTFPVDLPITERLAEIADALDAHQVVVVAGETGSGKSTQLAKLALALGHGERGMIGHTQPRRIAARAVAERVAEELGTTLGERVGFAVRFDDRVGADTQIKVMTDGILLAELQRDRSLRRYSVLIIDEAHERSLNIDFLLGCLRALLPRRPDLKVIITSATIDTARFSRHFDGAPVIEVSGRTYPVELRYQPLETDQTSGIVAAVAMLCAEGPGDILVFCSGEREIRDTVAALAAPPSGIRLGGDRWPTEVVPLFARLSAAEQHRVFSPHPGRRVVVATNVAETSLTVPGIRFVVDAGTARISRYSKRTKVQRLPIEPVSRASADQRAGRCGRLGPGICVRLYSEDDYDARPAFTDPEIQRTNLASVILQLASLRLGEIETFPFVDPPDERSIGDGIALLEELGAVDPERRGTRSWVTPTGRLMARIPADPRLARILVEGDRRGVLAEVLVIVANLSIQDPREHPAGQEEAARSAHARYRHPEGDFCTLLVLWEHLNTHRSRVGSSRFRRMCREEFLNFLRVRELQDVHADLRRVCRQLDLDPGTLHPTGPDGRGTLPVDQIHRALLAGFVSQVGMLRPRPGAAQGSTRRQRPQQGRADRQRPEYQGVRDTRFRVGRDSVLSRRSPQWIMAAELVETNGLWAHTVAAVQPRWIEEAASHLVRYHYGDPWWDAERGTAMVHENVTLHGLPVVSRRAIPLRRVDRTLARDLFVHHALCEGHWHGGHPFVAHNLGVLEQVRTLGARARRGDLITENLHLGEFFDERVPDDITSVSEFDRWWKQERNRHPNLFDLNIGDLVPPELHEVAEVFPDRARWDEVDVSLRYEYDPKGSADAVVVEVPVTQLPQVPAAALPDLVPGNRLEIVTDLLRSLPKEWRTQLIPMAESAQLVVSRLRPHEADLMDAVRREASLVVGRRIPADAFDLARVSDHLRPVISVVDGAGAELAVGRDVTELRSRLESSVRTALARTDEAGRVTRSGIRDLEIGEVPRTVRAGQAVAFPALVDEGDGVGVGVFADPGAQATAAWAGTRRLVLLHVPSPARDVARALGPDQKLALVHSPWGDERSYGDDLVTCALDHLIAAAGGPVWNTAGARALVRWARSRLPGAVLEVAPVAARILTRAASLHQRLATEQHAGGDTPSLTDMSRHLDRLVYPGCLTGIGWDHLEDVARYLKGIEYRLDRLPRNPGRDRENLVRCARLEGEVDALSERIDPGPELEALIWQLEELRVSLFAQTVGVRGTVSEQRIRRSLARLTD